MTTRKHNEFLDAPSDDDEASARGYESEENVAESKGRAVKKRRTDTQDFFGLESDEELSADDNDEEEDSRAKVKGKSRKQSKTTKRDSDLEEDEDDEDAPEAEDQDGDAGLEAESESNEKKKLAKILSTKSLKKPKKDKSGVVYLSSLPPYLKP